MTQLESKQKELIELLNRYFVVRTRPSLDELIRSAELKIELAELEQEPIKDELYKKVYIKTEDDLPEKVGNYPVHQKGFEPDYVMSMYYNGLPNNFWVQAYGWYLLPLEQESKGHSEKLGEKVQPSVENCGITCNGPDCEGCSDFNPKEQHPNKEAEVILENELNNIGFSFNEQLKPNGISIAQIRKVKKAVIKAMNIHAQQSRKEDETIKTLTEFSHQSRKNEINDILKCISKYSDTESLENKGRYFEVIQKDVRNLNPKP